jgi:hypothetical protein
VLPGASFPFQGYLWFQIGTCHQNLQFGGTEINGYCRLCSSSSLPGKHGCIHMIRRLTTHLLDVKYEKPCLHCAFLHLWCQVQTSWCYQTGIILRHALSVKIFGHSSQCLSSLQQTLNVQMNHVESCIKIWTFMSNFFSWKV